MAHEIGHLLLGEKHERFGMMRETWELADLRAAERGELLFLKDEASRIRAEVGRRMSAAKPVPGNRCNGIPHRNTLQAEEDMPTQYFTPPGGGSASKLPNVDREQDYFERLYLIDDPPADFRRQFEFDLPGDADVNHNRRIVVALMVDPTDGANMRYAIRLNGDEILSDKVIGGVKRGVWQVTSGEDLHGADATNTFEIWVLPDSDSRGFIRFSDIVIWYTST